MRLVVFTDHEIGARLIEHLARNRHSDDHEVAAVIVPRRPKTAWWPDVAALARGQGFETHVFEDLQEGQLARLAPDWLLLCSFKFKLDQALRAVARYGAVNMHYSLLPRLRGVYPVNWALIEGHERTGVTFHRATDRLDDGAILLQESLCVRPVDTAWSLLGRLDDLAQSMFPDLLRQMRDPEAAFAASREQGDAGASYRSYQDFEAVRRLEGDQQMRLSDAINLLRGLSFRAEAPLAVLPGDASQPDLPVFLQLARDQGAEDSG